LNIFASQSQWSISPVWTSTIYPDSKVFYRSLIICLRNKAKTIIDFKKENLNFRNFLYPVLKIPNERFLHKIPFHEYKTWTGSCTNYHLLASGSPWFIITLFCIGDHLHYFTFLYLKKKKIRILSKYLMFSSITKGPK
jgi:hypothetical protein